MAGHTEKDGGVQMKSVNFEFLRVKALPLADLGGFAEAYVYPDPASSLVKQRVFIENVVEALYAQHGFPRPYSTGLFDLLVAPAFQTAVPLVVQDKLHAVRKASNPAAHGKPVLTATALAMVRQVWDVACWLYIVGGGEKSNLPTWTPPSQPAPGKGANELLEKLRLTEASYDAQLKALQAKLAEAEQKASTMQQHVVLSEEALQSLKVEGTKAASILAFDEEATRRHLIDAALRDVGWDVGDGGKDTQQVKQEVQLEGLPTTSGKGRADYVLYGDDGKPLAVIEAKRTAKDATQGAEQARQYANALETKHGVRPTIFFTNGPETFIWDDAQKYPQRKVYGFYAKDSLEKLHFQRKNRQPLVGVQPSTSIAGRLYQLETLKRLSETFTSNHRKGLVVQATGTGKTRVAVSFCDILFRAGWAKRVLFLCDRRELRRQADKAFKEFLPHEPRVVVKASTIHDKDKRIYLATYPAMVEQFEAFDVGFFDLVIADESHRGIYNKFGSLFRYFDALQIGLTATPVDFIDRNTFGLFGCKDGDPTAAYTFADAIEDQMLVPYRVLELESTLHRDGIKFKDLSPEDQQKYEVDSPDDVVIDPHQLSYALFNVDTTRKLWSTLFDRGIRVAGGDLGKTIVFARSHDHAVHLKWVFDEMYPKYGSTFCRIIDNQEPKAEDLIDDFKSDDIKKELTIAISVDMLDTGIDVPAVVNLVFAKPIGSAVKFWQMLGRGTRLCEHLLGPGKHKTEFLIFDMFENVRSFEADDRIVEPPTPPKTLLQHLFEARIELAQAALNTMSADSFKVVVAHIVHDVRAVITTGAFEVKDHWKVLHQLIAAEQIDSFSATIKKSLLEIVSPLQKHRTVKSDIEAYRFDLLMTRAQMARLLDDASSPGVLNFKSRIENEVALLPKNLAQVKAQTSAILRVQSKAFWQSVTFGDLEELRLALRGIMQFKPTAETGTGSSTSDIDVADTMAVKDYVPQLSGLELAAYRSRVMAVLSEHFKDSAVLQQVKNGERVTQADLEQLAQLVLQVDDKANVTHLVGHDPETRLSLLAVFRSLVGVSAAVVDAAFVDFAQKHPQLSSQQLKFLHLLKNHIAQHGGLDVDRLFEAPFTSVHSDSIDGVFAKHDADALLDVLAQFEFRRVSAGTT